MPRRGAHQSKDRRPTRRRRNPTCSYVTATTSTGGRGGRSTKRPGIVIVVRPSNRTRTSAFVRYTRDADSESSFDLFDSPYRGPASGYRRRSRASHCSVCHSNQKYVPSKTATTAKHYRREVHNKVEDPGRRTRKGRSFGSMSTEPGSIRVKSRQGNHQDLSRAQQNPRYPAAPPPSHCSSSCDSIGRASIPQPNENWVPIPEPNRGRVESRSLQSSRMPSPAPSSIRQRSSANTLVEDQSPPTTLPFDQPGFLASGAGGVQNQGREWEEIQYDSSSYAGSGYEGHPTRSRLRSFLSGFRRTHPPSDNDHRTTSTKKSLVHRLLGSLHDKFTNRGNRFKGSADSNKSVRPASEGSIETDGSSNVIYGDAGCPVQLPELNKKEFLEAKQTGMSSWAHEMVNEFTTCTGSKYPPGEYDVLRAKFERNERTCE